MELQIRPVHPHACGDNEYLPTRRVTVLGSPPRVWGQPTNSLCVVVFPRFTPTRVGTTIDACRKILTIAVHPHACGDNMRMACCMRRNFGSPPRVWGQPDLAHPWNLNIRFTPTRVGTTRRAPRIFYRKTVHPHACGDNARSCSRRFRPNGSPPRVWGQPTIDLPRAGVIRFTPTRVGTTTTDVKLAHV